MNHIHYWVKLTPTGDIVAGFQWFAHAEEYVKSRSTPEIYRIVVV